MSDSTELRRLAASVDSARSGLASVLDDAARRHAPGTWTSLVAEQSRMRLATLHAAALESADRELASAALELRMRATALETAEATD